jgi:hypothetical protein
MTLYRSYTYRSYTFDKAERADGVKANVSCASQHRGSEPGFEL